MRFVLIHGAFSSPESNWFPRLKQQLSSIGQTVVAPQLPVDSWDEVTKNGSSIPLKNQNLENWLKAFKRVMRDFKKNEGLCFIGHSLGCVFILHAVEKFKLKLDSAIFVSPFFSPLNSLWQFDHANSSFYKTNFEFEKLIKKIPVSYVLYSDSDPYVSKSHADLFAKAMNSSFIFLNKAGHLNSEVNLNEFPLVLELCKTRLELHTYQQFIAHRSELYSVDYLKDRSEEVIYLNPNDVYGYGMFQFRNLSKNGFCTFLTMADYDPESVYMKEARKAAKRIKNLTRVFLVKSPEDLKKPNIIKHIKLDLEAGIKVYLCMFDKIKDHVREPDFGIWDESYCCFVSCDKKYQPVEVRLSSRKTDFEETAEWKKIIMKNAVQIKNTDEDIVKFIKKNF